MARYIEEKELREWVQNWFEKNRYYHPYSKSSDIPIPELYDILEQMPSADVVEKKKGLWLIFREWTDGLYDVEGNKTGGTIYCCSKCGYLHVGLKGFGLYAFCPHCGAVMR